MIGAMEVVPIEWLKAHEAFVEARVVELVERFQRTGAVDYAVVADRATGTVVDGHHRLEALRRLRARRVPVAFVDYLDPAFTLRPWRDDEPPPTKEDVLRRAKEGDLYPPKTTRHDFVLAMERVDVPLKALLEPDGRAVRA